MSRIYKKTINTVYSSDLYIKSLNPIFLNMKKENDSYMENRAKNESIYNLILKNNNEIFNGLKRNKQTEMILVFNMTINNRLN
jgi:hypothetical protein